MGLVRLLARDTTLTVDQYARLWETMRYGGNSYTVSGSAGMAASGAYSGNGVVFAVTDARVKHFSEVRFKWQRLENGRPTDLWGDARLGLLERPAPGMHTGDLLACMELDVTLYGNSYWVVVDRQLVRLNPENVAIVLEDVTVDGQPVGKRVLAYTYRDTPGAEGVMFPPAQVCHYRPSPAPGGFAGQSWLSAVLPDVNADDRMTAYKEAFVKNGAVPGLVVSFDATVTQDQFDTFMAVMDRAHAGPWNAGKTLYLAGGADVKTVGSDLSQLDFRAAQGAGETRIAAAGGVPAVIVGISEGLAGSALNAGNYSQSRRRFADGTLRPLWRSAAGALETLLPPPSGSRLWYDDRDIPFLQEDVQDDAEIKSRLALTMESMIRAGYEPTTVIDAVTSGDFTKLQHTGLYSVQLQPPNTAPAVPPAA